MATIIVIDDDPDILFLVRLTLEDAGHTVVASSDPASLEDLVKEHGADAVVLDVMMPRISGHDALRSLRRSLAGRSVPVLMLSAHADGPDRILGLREGADDFVAKPFEPEELVLRIERLLPKPAEGAIDPKELRNLEATLQSKRFAGPFSLGRYEARDVVGEGASGLILDGWDPWLERPVALKTVRVPKESYRAGSSPVDDLLHEAVMVARFNHPHIVTVYDVGGSAELAFIAMELVDGISLAQLIDRIGPFEAAQTLPLGLAMASGLAAAHRHRIVHHDVKPGNILLGRDGSVKVSDFGVAQLVTTLQGSPGTIFGTPGFLPPEVLLGEPYTESGDLFGLGVILYQCLTGEIPFARATARATLRATLRERPRPTASRRDDIPEELSLLISQLMSKDPSERPGHAAEVVERFEELAAGLKWTPPSAAFDDRATADSGPETGGPRSLFVTRKALSALEL